MCNVFQPCTHRIQLYITHLMGATPCGHHFVFPSLPAGRTEPGTLPCSTATCVYPVLPKTSGEGLSNLLSPCSTSESRLSTGFSNTLNATNKAGRNLAGLGLLGLRQLISLFGVQTIISEDRGKLSSNLCGWKLEILYGH